MPVPGASAHEADRASGSSVRAPLVGRDEVVALVARRWESARSGRGHTLLVAGEAGIGKSRLLDDALSRMPQARLVAAAAWPRDAQVVGALLLDLAVGLRRAGFDDAAAELDTRLRDDDNASGSARHRRLLIGDLSEVLLGVLSRQPTVLRLEDLHWADEVSLEIVERVATRLDGAPSMIVANYRSDELVPGSPLAAWRTRLLHQRTAEEVRLARLDLPATARLAEGIRGQVLPGAEAEALHQRSGGIPLNIEELLSAVPGTVVPETVADAVTMRLRSLSADARTAADAAAAFGRSFDPITITAVTGLAPIAADEALAELLDHHILVRTDDPGVLDFRHALIRDAIVERIPATRARALHAAIAGAGEGAGMSHAELSDHFERAGLNEQAFRHAVPAGRAAARASSHREAAALSARALRTAPADLPAPQRALLHADHGLQLAIIDQNSEAAAEVAEAVLLSRQSGAIDQAANLIPNLMGIRHLLGEPLVQRVARAEEALAWLHAEPSGGSPEVRARLYSALAAAYMLDRRLDESIRSGEQGMEIVESAHDRIDILATLGADYVFAGEPHRGWQLLEQALSAGSAAGAEFEVETARAHRMHGSCASVLVEYDRAEAAIAAGMAMTRATERWNDHHYLRSHRAHVAWATGDPSAAREAAQSLADGDGVTTRITSLHVLGYAALGRGDTVAARGHLGAARELAEGMNELQRLSPALWGLAEAALLEGRIDEAVELSERGRLLSGQVDDAAYLFPFVVTGTRARLQAGGADARGWLELAAEPLRRRGIPGTLPAIDHAEGLIAAAERRIGDARASLERARDGWDARRRFWEGTHVRLDLAVLARRSRRPGEQAALLAEVRARAASADAPLFGRLADALAGDDSVASESLGPLTTREFEIARLVAEGATNREIAERLVISPKTVSAHVEHILTKLHVSRRAEIAAWVARSGTTPGTP